MKKHNKLFLYVLTATVIEFGIMVWLNSVLYKGIFNLGMLMPALSIQVVVAYNYTKGKLKTKWGKTTVGLFFSVAIILFFIGKPTYTFEQAKQLVYERESVSKIVDHKDESYRNTVPIYTEETRFFIHYRDYHFEAEERFFLVNPRTGEVIEMKEPYWH